MKTFFSWVAVLCFIQGVAQHKGPVFAYPMDDITVDGDLTDWPKEIETHALTQIFDDPTRAEDDFQPSFRIGYHLKEKALYVAVAVVDSDYLALEKDATGPEDTMTMYLDLLHNPNGGSNVLFSAGKNYRDITKRSKLFDPTHQFLDWNRVEVAVGRTGNTTIYEWKFQLGTYLKVNKPLGIDFFISDQDTGQEEGALAIWTPQFAKSVEAIRLGDVIPVASEVPYGEVKGKVVRNDTLIRSMERVKLLHTSNSDLWFQASVDSLGQYQSKLPVGTYRIEPTYRMTTDLYFQDFNSDARQIVQGEEVLVSITSGASVKAKPLELGTLEKPKHLFYQEGALYRKNVEIDRINDFVTAYQDYYQIPGISVAIIKDGKVIYEKNAGVMNVLSKRPVTQQSLFEGASTTKTLLAVMVLRLVERGVLELDKPLYEYLVFPNIEKDPRSKLLTARLILNHQSGLDNWPFPSKFGGPGGWENGPEIQLNFEPGTQFGYSGAAFNYLGRVVAHVTGKSLSQVFQEEVAVPFGLENTYFTFNESIADQLVTGHYQTYPTYKDRTDIDSPASSVMTNASDFSKFVLGLMKEEHMSKASYESIYTPYTILTPEQKLFDPEIPQGVANGFFVQDTAAGKVIAHGGNNGDFDCKYAYNPQKGVGYVVFTNNSLGEEFVRALELFLFYGNGNSK